MAETTAMAVAYAFLEIQERDRLVLKRIDQMKLHKLVYYAQAWWLGNGHEPLFDDKIEAWPWGPMIPSIYPHFQPAKLNDIDMHRLPGPDGSRFDEMPEKVWSFLEQVWDTHKDFTGHELSYAAHKPKEPWAIVTSRHDDTKPGKPEVTHCVMRDVFGRKVREGNAKRQ